MSINHAHARTIAEANPGALAWVKSDQGGQVPEVFGLYTVLRAFGAGQIKGASQYGGPLWAVTAVRLLRGAAATFRSYEAHHQDQGTALLREGQDAVGATEAWYEAQAGKVGDRLSKAAANRKLAETISEFLAGEDIPRDTVAELAAELVKSVDDLIGSSEGVAGLHRNGDLAPWDTLVAGGEFEPWLAALDDMRAGLDAIGMPETRMAEGATASEAQTDREIDDPAAFVRTIETAVAADLIPGVTADDLSLMRIGARLGMTDKDTPLELARKGLDAWASVPVYGQKERDEAIRVLMQTFDQPHERNNPVTLRARGMVVDLIAKTLGLTYRDVRTDQDRS